MDFIRFHYLVNYLWIDGIQLKRYGISYLGIKNRQIARFQLYT